MRKAVVTRAAALAVMAVFLAAWQAAAADLKAGEELFKRKCMGCHRLSDGTKAGPGLEGVTVRRTEEWMHEWLTDPKAMIDKGDPVAVELLAKFKKVMTKVSAMDDEENRKNIIAFLKDNDIKRGVRESEN